MVDDGLWLAEGEIVSFYGFPYSTRSVVVRLAEGHVWVWSPIRLTDGLRREVDRLGQVAHLVSPNKLHHLYLAQFTGCNANQEVNLSSRTAPRVVAGPNFPDYNP